jgi:hypothetical protein
MKITWNDTRRVHAQITYFGNEDTRSEQPTQWGDVRTVSVLIEPDDGIEDMLSGSYSQRVMFRPETAHLQWQRHRFWGSGGYLAGWAPVNRRQVDGWWLANAGIRGTNIKKDGTPGKRTESILYQNDDGWGRHAGEPPQWFLALMAQYDPDLHPSKLDNEPTGLLA